MKTILSLLVLLFILTTLPSASAQRAHEFQIRAGFGFAAYATVFEETIHFGNIPYYVKSEDGAATAHMPLELRYEFSDKFNGGLDLKFGSYLYDPSDTSTSKSNNFTVVGPAAEYAISNKDNFRWYVGAGFNTCTLQLNETYGDGSHQQQIWRGGGFRFNTGIIRYFGDGPLGFNANIGYDSHRFDLQEMTIDGQSVDLDNIDASLSVGGTDFTIGLLVRIR